MFRSSWGHVKLFQPQQPLVTCLAKSKLICSSSAPPPVVLSLQSTGVCVLGGSVFQRACLRGTSSAWIARSPAGRDCVPFHDTNQSCPSFNLLGAGWTQDTAPMGWCMHLAPDWRAHLCPLSLPWQPSFFCPRKMRRPGGGEDLQLNLWQFMSMSYEYTV